MRILVAEDDRPSGMYLQKVFEHYEKCDWERDGKEALDAFLSALDAGQPYDLICLDIMLPKLDGLKVLKAVRNIESQRGIAGKQRVKVIITTGLSDIFTELDKSCEVYMSKPIQKDILLENMKGLGLL